MVGAAWGVTARKSSHNAGNARGVAAGKMGRNSSDNNNQLYLVFVPDETDCICDNTHNIFGQATYMSVQVLTPYVGGNDHHYSVYVIHNNTFTQQHSHDHLSIHLLSSKLYSTIIMCSHIAFKMAIFTS